MELLCFGIAPVSLTKPFQKGWRQDSNVLFGKVLWGWLAQFLNKVIPQLPPWLNLWRKPELDLLPLELDFLYGLDHCPRILLWCFRERASVFNCSYFLVLALIKRQSFRPTKPDSSHSSCSHLMSMIMWNFFRLLFSLCLFPSFFLWKGPWYELHEYFRPHAWRRTGLLDSLSSGWVLSHVL